MTTPPDTHTVDQALAQRCASSGEYIAGLLAAAMLDVVGQPEKLPALLLPDLDPAVVDRVWNIALPVGVRLGGLARNPRWAPDALREHKAALSDAGYDAMARLAARSANTTDPHPADTEPVKAALSDAGYDAMARLAARSANTTDPHPADTEPVREHP
ncbi:hypothetical protein GPZ77_34790 (plasmid) [Streptomyces sp. QHH-9511]|uniref:hypothetical protein n=1 Tax=Streptomyces sp. QHH-9511 TaxID=2684468 RepID=UPI001318C311|nr:hypothetical protein [Streptomyces sp. QHH-9511]QGZ53396.1 hypothetical protein GPZ77_34790 [Streptomyces sp. QHH-9511]